MAEVKESIEVQAPISIVYNQWTQFEEFPKFMENVERAQQIDDTHLKWEAEIGGSRSEWIAEITEQEPDRGIAWRSQDGKGVSGEVRFEPIGPERTKIDVLMTWEPEGLVESLGAKIGADEVGVKRDLENFKRLIEARGVETGAWRGEVEQGQRAD
ncbi:MAG TPA: SRPBCC family protein [Gaiellaceae bacterium]|jgi:uncharacterized membrane protein|nr:SRPBCC family protein [Gaiellaceae bacterium]